MDAEYIRPAAASTRFSVSARTLSRWARFGWIGTSRIGGVRLYRASDIEDLIARNETRRAVVPMPAAAPAPMPEQWWNTDFWADADRISASRGGRR